jgi:hypothetical protein
VKQLVNAELAPQLGAADRAIQQQQATGDLLGQRLAGYQAALQVARPLFRDRSPGLGDEFLERLHGADITPVSTVMGRGPGS